MPKQKKIKNNKTKKQKKAKNSFDKKEEKIKEVDINCEEIKELIEYFKNISFSSEDESKSSFVDSEEDEDEKMSNNSIL